MCSGLLECGYVGDGYVGMLDTGANHRTDRNQMQGRKTSVSEGGSNNEKEFLWKVPNCELHIIVAYYHAP